MTKPTFIYIAGTLLIFPFLIYTGGLSIAQQLILCTPFLLIFGIPHGAIDNILFLRNKTLSNFTFISIYLTFIIANIMLWLWMPVLAYAGFLLISAYHFGQSQFSHYLPNQKPMYKLLYFVWGVSVLSGLIFFNFNEIVLIMDQNTEFAAIGLIHSENITKVLFFGGNLLTLLLMVIMNYKRQLIFEQLALEVLVLGLIYLSFYLMPLLVGFTMYFVILHSFKVLKEEYLYLQSEQKVSTLIGFIKMLLPLSLLSVLGIVFMFVLIYLDFLNISYGYLLLIAISSITLPHVFVMNRFYDMLLGKSFYLKSTKI